MTDTFEICFLGVRGSFPMPMSERLRYGGNTSCVLVRCGELELVLDAGTGLSTLGERTNLNHLHILLSHTHIDHIIGLCSLKQLFNARFSGTIWAGHLLPELDIRQVLMRLISPPIFPVAMDTMPASLAFHDFHAGQPLHHPDFAQAGLQITTLPLNHPDKATGYRLEHGGHSICYITDIEHVRDGLNDALISFVRDTDYFIYDCTYDDRNYDAHEGMGHSTWQEAMRIGEAANVGTVVLFHHDPSASDTELDARAEEAARQFSVPSLIARENLTLKPGR